MEVCPSCGKFVTALRADTGWCPECSGTPESSICIQCGNLVLDTHRVCSTCRARNWLLRNIDAIEEYMITGLSFNESIERVKEDNKPQCRNCGATIQRGTFCRDKMACRRAYYRFKSYRLKGHPSDVALQLALREAS